MILNDCIIVVHHNHPVIYLRTSLLGHLGGFQKNIISQSHCWHIKHQTAILERHGKNFHSSEQVPHNSLIKSDIPHAYFKKRLALFFLSPFLRKEKVSKS